MTAPSGAENIALVVSSSAKLEGIRQARAEVAGLGKATAAAASEAAQAQTGLAGAAQQAATAQNKISVTAEQSREAMKRANGDFEQFKRELAKIVEGEQALTTATRQATVAQEQLNAAQRAAPATVATAPGAGVPGASASNAPANTLAVAAAQNTAALARQDSEIKKIPGSTRTAANAIAIMAQAAATGSGSMAGLAAAAGGLTQGIAMLSTSAKVAAAASGIGALVTVAAVLIELFHRLGEETDNLSGSLHDLSGFSAEGLRIQEDAQRKLVQTLTEDVASYKTLVFGAGKAAYEELQKQQARLAETIKARIAAERDAEKDKQRELERLAKEAADRRERDSKKADELEAAAGENAIAITEKMSMSEEQAAIRKIDRDRQRRLQEATELEISLDDMARLELAINMDTEAQIAEVKKKSRDKQADEDKKRAEEEAKIRRDALGSLVKASADAVGAAVKAHESLKNIAIKAALAPIVKELEALAVSEGVKAVAHFATGDIGGGLAHTAASGLASAAAAKVANQGGLNSSGGGGNAGTSYTGGDNYSTRARDNERGGNTTVNLYTVDPYNRETIGVVSYELQRAGVTKRPIYVPPTRGLTGEAA